MDEQALIAAAVRGELRAFNQLLLHHQALAYHVAFRMLDDTDAAADAVQEAAIKAFRALKTYRGGSFKAWFLRIVTNNCYDWLRARSRHGVSSLDDMAEDPDYAEALVHTGEGPEAHALREELSDFISRSVNSLPADQRLTLILADIEGIPYQEVAEICSVPLGTVKSRLSRARMRLRDLLLQRAELLPQRYRLETDRDGR